MSWSSISARHSMRGQNGRMAIVVSNGKTYQGALYWNRQMRDYELAMPKARRKCLITFERREIADRKWSKAGGCWIYVLKSETA